MQLNEVTKTEPNAGQTVTASVDADAVKAAFSAWLVGNGKKISPVGAIASLEAASDRFIKRKLSDVSIWNMVPPELFSAVHNKAIKDKLFCVLTGHKNLKFYRQCSQLYFDFLKARMSEPQNESLPASHVVPSNITLIKEIGTIEKPTPDGFISWLITQPNRNGTSYLEHVARAYLSSLRTAPNKLLIKSPITELDVFTCKSTMELEQLWSVFKQAPNYRDVNISTSSQFSAGMNCLMRYLEFLSNGGNNSEKNSSILQENTANEETQVASNGNDNCVYNWIEGANINGTKPISVKFAFSKAFHVTSWKSLLSITYDFFATQFPAVDITATSYKSGRRKLCSYNSKEVSYPAKTSCGLYYDSAWSANDVIGIIKALCVFCGYDVSNVEICYASNGSSVIASGSVEAMAIADHTDEEKRVLNAFKDAFPISMNLGFVDLKKLQVKHEELYGEPTEFGDEKIYSLIRNNSIQVDINRYTHIDNLVSPESLAKVKLFLDSELAKPTVHRVYSKPLFEEFKSEISYAVNEELLLTIIETIFGNKYKANRKSMFISLKNNSYTPNVGEEIAVAVIKLLGEEIQPFTVDEIAQRLPCYPWQKIEAILNNLPNELVRVSSDKYAHIDYVYIEQNDIEKIKTLISDYININGAMTGDELYAKITEDVPDIIELNPEISKSDILKVVKNKLCDAFTVKQDWQSGLRFLPKEGV